MSIDLQHNNTILISQDKSHFNIAGSWPQRIKLWEYLALYSLWVGSVLAVLFDWLGQLEYISINYSKYSRAFLLVIFTFYVIRTGINLSAYGFRFGRVLTYFILLCLLYSIMSENVIENLYYTIRTLFWILGTVVAYRLFISGLFTEKIITRMIIATVITGAAFTIFFISTIEPGKYDNASAYLLLWCMPLLFLFKKSWIVNTCIVMATMAIIITAKRGAVLGLLLSMSIYGLIYFKMHMRIRTVINIILVVFALGTISAYVLSSRLDFIEKRFEDKSGSGRDYLYTILINHYVDADVIHHIFGFGINSVQNFTGHIYRQGNEGAYAHSDWLQFMYDFGVFGIIFLVWLHLQFLVLIFKHYKNNSPHAPPLLMGYVILFLVNIYSGQLTMPNIIYLGLLWAISPSEYMAKSNI